MYLQIRVQTHVTSVLFMKLFLVNNQVEVCKRLRMGSFPFGNREDQQGKPDKTEREQLGHAKRLVEKENTQKQGHRGADILEKAQHI